MPVNRSPMGARRQGGFSLIEVMIALLILAFGLLGFALMQTMGVRFAQSSNYRTQATNLAYDLLDQMRSNRLLAAQYAGATFSSGTAAPAAGCSVDVAAPSIAKNIAQWQCRVRWSLGEGAAANVTYNNGQANVTITWNDQRWAKDEQRMSGAGQVSLRTRL